MSDAGDRAKSYFSSGFNCAQSVLRSVLEEKNMYFDEAPFLTAGFGGGIGLEGNTCGAVTGAVMALGMLLAENQKDPIEVKNKAYALTPKLLEQFRDKYGTTMCSQLVGFDMNDARARQKASEEKLFQNICPKFVSSAVDIVLALEL